MSERPGDGHLDVDAAWAEIVAHWGVDGDDLRVVRSGEDPQHPAADATDRADGDGDGEGADEPSARGEGTTPVPPTEDGDERPVAGGATLPLALPPTPPAAQPPASASAQVDRPPGADDAVRAAARPPVRRDDLADDDPLLAALDEHFVPPEPPPLGGGDPLTTLAWLGALGGPVFLLVAALAWRSAPSVLIGAAVLAFVAGFVTLVVRMPDRDEDDDGAEV